MTKIGRVLTGNPEHLLLLNSMRPLSAQKGFAPPIVIILVGLVVLGVAGYFIINTFNKPARIKEKSETLQPIFKDYKKTVENVIEHLEEHPESDADSFERYIKRGEGFLKTAQESNKTIKSQVDRLPSGDFLGYKEKLEEYLSKSAEAFKLEGDELALSNALLGPIRDYEDLSTDIQGVSSYAYSDPARYVKEVGEAITKEEAIIKQIKDTKADGTQKKYLEAILKTYDTELKLLKKAKAAVEARDNSSLTKAIQDYSQEQQDNGKELTKVIDEFEDKVKEQKDALKDLADDVDEEYSKLKQQYNF